MYNLTFPKHPKHGYFLPNDEGEHPAHRISLLRSHGAKLVIGTTSYGFCLELMRLNDDLLVVSGYEENPFKPLRWVFDDPDQAFRFYRSRVRKASKRLHQSVLTTE